MIKDPIYPDLATLTTLIARSPIVVMAARPNFAHFPAGFDEADVAILQWIAAEGCRAGRAFSKF